MTDAAPPPLPDTPAPAAAKARTVPVVGIILIAWIAIWLLMMWYADWPWIGSVWYDIGNPGWGTLKMFGAVVPAAFRWQAVFLAPLLHGSLIGLVFLLFFWRGVGRTVVGLVGPSWTWALFVAGGAAATWGHLQAHPLGALPWAVGPIDPILAGVGLQLGWGVQHREQHGLAGRAIKTLVMLCIFMLLFALASGVQISQLATPAFREAMGAEGMLAALVAGLGIAFVIGIGRRLAPAATTWLGRGLALVALGGVLYAGTTQAVPLLQQGTRTQAEDMLEQLARTERGVKALLDQTKATDALRNDLAREHGRLVNHAFLEEFEGREALLAYAQVLAAYMRPVEAPFITEPQLKRRFRTWYDEHEKPLRERLALPARPYDPWAGL